MLLGVILLSSAAAFGAARDFLPTIYSSGGDFELDVISQIDENTAAGRGTKSTDLFASERLRLHLDGFVYHPRFLQFQIKGAGGLSQERSENTFGGSFSENGFGEEYDFRTKILPQHPYNLELYTQRATPLLRGRSSANTRPTLTDKGVIFNYAKNPFFFNLGYNAGATEARVSSTAFRTARVDGSYISGPFTNSAGYSRTNSSTSLGTHVANDYSYFENNTSFFGASLDSRLNRKQSAQFSPFSAGLDTDTLSWTEHLNAALPWNFSASASYNLRSDVLSQEQAAAESRLETKSETQGTSFMLAHKLYDSVRTAYAVNRTTSETSSGDSRSLSNSLNGVYTKRIPDGRITIGLQGSRSVVDRESAPLVVGEVYTAPLFGTFTLLGEGVDPATIAIRALSDAGALVDLERDTDYIVEPFGNTAVITIISLPPEVSANRPAGFAYTFQVTYALKAGNVKFESASTGFTVNLALLNNLMNPYYSRQHTGQEVLSGSIPGGAQETDTEVIGVNIQKKPYAIVSEYRTIKSNITPAHSLRNIAEYTRKISDTMGFSARAQHTETVYGEGSLASSGYSEQISVFSLVINKAVTRTELNTSLGASYSQRRATFDTDLYAITGNLSWKAGTLFVNMGASLNHAESAGANGKQTLLSELYYMNVSRKLF